MAFPFTENVNNPEDEVWEADEVVDERMLGWELLPVRVNDLQQVAVHSVQQRGALGAS